MKSATPLIKGYLPVRLYLPTGEETFFYIKEHHQSSSNSTVTIEDAAAAPSISKRDSSGTKRRTSSSSNALFVVNAPVVPSIPTKLVLQSLLGRYGDVVRVTVVENPRTSSNSNNSTSQELTSISTWTNKFVPPSFLPLHSSSSSIQGGGASRRAGKFAHVNFSSPSELKQALKAITSIMTASSHHSKNGNNDSNPLPGLVISKNELQTLRQDDDSQTIDKAEGHGSHHSAVSKLAVRYRNECRDLISSRDSLFEECNIVMRDYEQAEECQRQARIDAANQPDEDGFITVVYQGTTTNNTTPTADDVAPSLSSQRQLDEDRSGLRRKGPQKRKRKKNSHGASELGDFYRFQTKHERKKTLHELRQSFEEDLAKVRKMKEDRKCVPF